MDDISKLMTEQVTSAVGDIETQSIARFTLYEWWKQKITDVIRTKAFQKFESYAESCTSIWEGGLIDLSGRGLLVDLVFWRSECPPTFGVSPRW